MHPKIPAGFRGGSLPTPNSLPGPLKESKVTRLEHLKPLLASSAAPDDTHIGLSGGYWKLKPNPGGDSFFTSRDLKVADARNAALFSRSLSERDCATLAPALLRAIRGDGGPLSKGHLRLELLALRLIDLARREGLNPRQASALVEEVFATHQPLGNTGIEIVVGSAAALMKAPAGLGAAAALAAASEPPRAADFETKGYQAQSPSFLEAAVRDLLRGYLSAPSAGADLMARLNALAPRSPLERSEFGGAVRRAIEAGMLAGITIDAGNCKRFDELALCLARFEPWGFDGLRRLLDLLHGPGRRGAEAALDLVTTFLAEDQAFSDWSRANYHDDLRYRLEVAIGIPPRFSLWTLSEPLTVPQLQVLARAFALHPDAIRGCWQELIPLGLPEQPYQIVLRAGCMAAARTGRDPVVQRLVRTLWFEHPLTKSLEAVEEDLRSIAALSRGDPNPLGADVLAWLGAHMLEDPLCVFDPATALPPEAAARLPRINSEGACALLEDFYKIKGLFDARAAKAHLKSILSDARIDEATRLDVAQRLLRAQPLSRGGEQFGEWMTPHLSALQQIVKGEAPDRNAVAQAVDRMADTWEQVLQLAVAVEDREGSPIRSIGDAVGRVRAQWAAADELLQPRWSAEPMRDGPSPTMLLRQRMEQAIGDAYLSIPEHCGLGPGSAAIAPAALDNLLAAVRAQQGLWPKEDTARRIEAKGSAQGVPATSIPLWALRQVEEQILQARDSAERTAPRPGAADGKPAPRSRTLQAPMVPGAK